MKNYIIKYLDPVGMAAGGAAGAALGPVGLGLSAAQIALGVVQGIKSQNIYDKYSPQLKAFKTPEEIYKIVNATSSRQGGLSASTLAYLTNQNDRSFGASLGTATRLGADPNDLSSLYQNNIDAVAGIGQMNEIESMKNFEKYLSAQNLLADNKAAEQKSQQDLIKDKLQKAGVDKISALQNIAGGANTAIGTLSSIATSNLFGNVPAVATVPAKTGLPGGTTFDFAPPASKLPAAVGLSDYVPPDNDAAVQQAINLLRKRGFNIQ